MQGALSNIETSFGSEYYCCFSEISLPSLPPPHVFKAQPQTPHNPPSHDLHCNTTMLQNWVELMIWG